MSGIQFSHANGPSIDDCLLLAMRYDARLGVDKDTLEGWVLQRTKGGFSVEQHRPGSFVGLWRSLDGRCFAAQPEGSVLVRRSGETGAPWREFELPAALGGVSGVSDDLAFAWGVSDGRGAMFHFDGTEWTEHAIDGIPRAVHGVREDLVFAVGDEGYIGRWDGVRWQRMAPPAGVRLRGVFVVDDDEIYAIAKHQVFAGTIYGWTELCVVEPHLFAVAKHAGVVYVGAGAQGLYRLDDAALVEVDSTVHATTLEVREDLLITAANAVLTPDRAGDYAGFTDEAFIELSRGVRPMWDTDD